MNRIIPTIILAITLAFAGCKGSPNAIAYKTTAATVATVDSGMQAWAQYVRHERVLIATLPPIDQGAKGSDLTRTEGRVRDAFGKYQTAIAAADVGVTAADNSPVAPEVAGAASALLSIIQANVKH